MKFAYAALALAATAMSQGVIETLSSDVNKIGVGTANLTFYVQQDQSDLGTYANNVVTAEQLLSSAIDQGINDAKVVRAAALSLLNQVVGLIPGIKASIDATIKSINSTNPIAAAPPIILAQLKNQTDTLSGNLSLIAPADQACAAASAAYTVDVLFNSGLAYYNATTVAPTIPATCQGGSPTAPSTVTATVTVSTCVSPKSTLASSASSPGATATGSSGNAAAAAGAAAAGEEAAAGAAAGAGGYGRRRRALAEKRHRL